VRLILHHYWRSSSSWRVRWALAHKRASYESLAIDLLKGAQSDASYVEKSPMGLVPCLFVDGRALTESVAIIEYLEETIPEPALYPRDPWARARVRQLVEFVNSGTQPLQNLGVNRYFSSDGEKQREWARHWIVRGLAAIERELEVIHQEGLGGRFAVGDALSAADVYLIPQLYNARRFGVDLVTYPRLTAVEAAALATESAEQSHPDRFQPA